MAVSNVTSSLTPEQIDVWAKSHLSSELALLVSKQVSLQDKIKALCPLVTISMCLKNSDPVVCAIFEKTFHMSEEGSATVPKTKYSHPSTILELNSR